MSTKKLVELAEWVQHETERKERGCRGSHSQYSSMANDDLCPICKEWEDGPGGTIVTHEPTKKAILAKEALAEFKAEQTKGTI